MVERHTHRIRGDMFDVGQEFPADGDVWVWDATRDLIVPRHAANVVKAAGVYDTGLALADTNITVAATATDWGAAVTLANPGAAVNITASVHGMITDFATAAPLVSSRVGISIDGGSSFTFCAFVDDAINGGGAVPNRSPQSTAHVRANVTPTGSIVVKAQAKSSSTTATAQSGTLLVHTSPA